jgi:drug/metabolite transporter (DMT)-like permease
MSELADRPQGPGYDGAAVLGGVLMTIFFPLIALIAALLLHGGEANPVRRKQLRTWAWLSGGLIALQIIVFVVIFMAIASHMPGGPGVPPSRFP